MDPRLSGSSRVSFTCVNADTYVTGQLPRLFVPLVMSQAEVDGFYYCCCLYFCLFELGFSFPRRVLSLGLHACRSNILPLSYISSLWSSLIIIAQHTEHYKPSKIPLNKYNASPMQSEHLWLVIHVGVVICSHLKMHAKKKGENFPFYPAFQRRLIFLKLYINWMPTFLNSQSLFISSSWNSSLYFTYLSFSDEPFYRVRLYC